MLPKDKSDGITVAGKLAEYGLGLTFQDLPREVLHQAKRCILDTIGCAFGGYSSDASRILRDVIHTRGPGRSTIIGDGTRTSCLDATLANGAMVRYLDYNDVYEAAGKVHSGNHPSEMIPPVFALGEQLHSSGQQVLTAIVLGYELSARFVDACTINLSLDDRGWNVDMSGNFTVPVVAGKLLGLVREQVENAIGISGSHGMTLDVLDAPKEEYTMTKNLRFPFAACNAIQACFLAQKGFTGPTRVIEGQSGFVESVMQGEFDLKKFTDFKGFKIMNTAFKLFPAAMSTHGIIAAALTLVNEHNIKPEDIEQVKIRATPKDAEHTGQSEKRYPKNKETADHSSYYLTAIAIIDRKVGPEQYAPEKLGSPRVLELIDKVRMEPDPELEGFAAVGIVEITTKQGAKYRNRVDYPRGDPHNPMTDEEVENKFRSMASKYIGENHIEKIIQTVYELEKINDIGNLMKLLVFKH